ncbi:MAG: DUF4145 domain-containing protein [Nanoarchaeota archaeon]|nr:DUF4145 domain-containing protein [Nanoarchaeota archaeon]MBU1005523.1 DUF4145 domain-containing protein [Nanoarchaeota archaeon]MBU1945862.1 DUF4145 domain-containing protein [Nanoarchaeota archaeon]
MEFQKSLENLQNAISSAIKIKLDLTKKIDAQKALYDYSEKQKIYHLNTLNSSLKAVKSYSIELLRLVNSDIKNQPYTNQILELIPELESKDLTKLDKTVKKMISISKQLNIPKKTINNNFSTPSNIPSEIKSDISADISELNRCFNNGCYRSSIILCGRLLETALHRKYYELTNNDLLEKSPGIGLGNIIAKLKEKNIQLDPALSNQIHLINQVRVFSVHKKKEAFYPTKEQAHAIILYTIDVLGRLFSNVINIDRALQGQ